MRTDMTGAEILAFVQTDGVPGAVAEMRAAYAKALPEPSWRRSIHTPALNAAALRLHDLIREHDVPEEWVMTLARRLRLAIRRELEGRS